MSERAQTAVVELAAAGCDGSNDVRRCVCSHEGLLTWAATKIAHCFLEPAAAYAQGVQPPRPHLLGACVGLVCAVVCVEGEGRQLLRGSGIAEGLAQTAAAANEPARTRAAAAVSVAFMVGAAWPAWAHASAKDLVLRHVVQVCMCI